MELTSSSGAALPGRPPAGSGGGSPGGCRPQRLLLAAGAGDEAAFGALYDHVAPLLYGLIQRVLPDAAQADKVLLEAMVEIWRVAPAYNADQGSAIGWLYTITAHHAMRCTRLVSGTFAPPFASM